MKRRGQVTIFIILGILIVAGVLIFFLNSSPRLTSTGGSVQGFESCVGDAVLESITKIEKTAGYIEPEFVYLHEGLEIPYLCFTNAYFNTCTIQKPFLKQHFESELKKDIKRQVGICYESSLNDLRDRGFDVTSGAVEYEVVLEPGTVRLELDAPTVVGSSSFKRFNVRVNSPIYEMVTLVTSVIQSETRFGDFNTDAIPLDYSLQKLKQGDGTTIYLLTHKNSKSLIRFASRSLVFPPGYIGA